MLKFLLRQKLEKSSFCGRNWRKVTSAVETEDKHHVLPAVSVLLANETQFAHKQNQIKLQLDRSQLHYSEYSGPILQEVAQPNAQYKKGPYKYVWSQNSMVHKYSNFFTRTMNQSKTMSLVTIYLNKLCSTLVQLVNTLAALKIIILYVQGVEKRKLKHTNTNWSQNRTENLFFINLDRYPICRAVVESWG